MLAVHVRHVTMYENVAFFLLSIMINAFGNALTVSLNLGSALWTASSVNFTRFTGVPLNLSLFLFGLAVILINSIILRKLEWHRILGNLVFMVPFSYLIGWTNILLIGDGINQLPLFIRIILDIVGVCLISMAISIYQRVNLMLHPCDDFMQIIRFKFFRGSATIAQLVTFLPPIVIVLICWIKSGHLYAINIGTIFALLFQGTLVGVFDKMILPSLKHQHLEKNA